MKISGDRPDAGGIRGRKSAADIQLAPSQSGGLWESSPEKNPGPSASHDNDLEIVDLPIPRWSAVETVKSKWETILILITIVGSLVLLVNPRFDSLDGRMDTLEDRMDSLEAKVDENTVAITNLDSKIDAVEANLNSKIDTVEAKFDNRFENLANMMIVAHTNGNVTEAELVEIWERVNAE